MQVVRTSSNLVDEYYRSVPLRSIDIDGYHMSLLCSIELDREQGVTVRVTDDKGAVTQIIHLDGTNLSLEVKSKNSSSRIEQKDAMIKFFVEKGANKSSYIQTPESFEVSCKNFKLDADTIHIESSAKTDIKAGNDLTISSKGDLELSSQGQMGLSTKGNLSASSSRILSLKGGSKASLSAPQVDAKGTAKMALSSGTLLQMKATKVDIKAQAQLTAGAPITNLGQNMTSVKGQLIKVEGALVKIG